MRDYRHDPHTVFSMHLPIVWIAKYCRKVPWGESAERVRETVREACRKAGLEIVRDHISSDHVRIDALETRLHTLE